MSGYVVEALTDSRMHESDTVFINPFAWQLINSGEDFRMNQVLGKRYTSVGEEVELKHL